MVHRDTYFCVTSWACKQRDYKEEKICHAREMLLRSNNVWTAHDGQLGGVGQQ